MLQTMQLQEDLYNLSQHCFRDLSQRMDTLSAGMSTTTRLCAFPARQTSSQESQASQSNHLDADGAGIEQPSGGIKPKMMDTYLDPTRMVSEDAENAELIRLLDGVVAKVECGMVELENRLKRALMGPGLDVAHVAPKISEQVAKEKSLGVTGGRGDLFRSVYGEARHRDRQNRRKHHSGHAQTGMTLLALQEDIWSRMNEVSSANVDDGLLDTIEKVFDPAPSCWEELQQQLYSLGIEDLRSPAALRKLRATRSSAPQKQDQSTADSPIDNARETQQETQPEEHDCDKAGGGSDESAEEDEEALPAEMEATQAHEVSEEVQESAAPPAKAAARLPQASEAVTCFQWLPDLFQDQPHHQFQLMQYRKKAHGIREGETPVARAIVKNTFVEVQVLDEPDAKDAMLRRSASAAAALNR
ncbi:YPTC1 [Symbiodinium sp. KB8]|nr:YPTC1 [Symbiodinium sp. KB8]